MTVLHAGITRSDEVGVGGSHGSDISADQGVTVVEDACRVPGAGWRFRTVEICMVKCGLGCVE